MEAILARYNPWWDDKEYSPQAIERPLLMQQLKHEIKGDSIVLLTGLRHIGKTTAMQSLITYLIQEQSVDPQHILYVSLDDYRLLDYTMFDIIDAFRSMHRLSFSEYVYVFFDEVTFQNNCEQQLKNLYDSKQLKIVASSSSASLLRSKKPFLTGRNATLLVQPLNFEEYLSFTDTTISKANTHLEERYFEDFLFTGGLPEYVLKRQPDYIQHVVDDILSKDIIAHHSIKDPKIIKDLFLLLMERSGKQMSLHKIANILGISPDTARRYVGYLEETYIIDLVSRSGKTNERLLSPKKVYAADTGIRTFFTGIRDKSSLFENYVYIQLQKKQPLYVYEQGAEIDFILENGTLIEAKYGQKELSTVQKKLFDSFQSDSKFIVRSYRDLQKII